MRYKCRVILIPWDHESAVHRAVLLKQREDCGWHSEKVEKEWREAQAKGDKCLYWIVSQGRMRSSIRFYAEILICGTRLLNINKVLLSDDSHMTEEMRCHLRFKESSS
jgi:hypothetical protein